MHYKHENHDDEKYKKILGKIEDVSFGLGGYQDAQFGLTLVLKMRGFSTCVFISGGWAHGIVDPDIKNSNKWNESDRDKSMSEMCKKISQILQDTKVRNIDSLKGKPVEIASEGWNKDFSWRIVEELL